MPSSSLNSYFDLVSDGIQLLVEYLHTDIPLNVHDKFDCIYVAQYVLYKLVLEVNKKLSAIHERRIADTKSITAGSMISAKPRANVLARTSLMKLVS